MSASRHPAAIHEALHAMRLASIALIDRGPKVQPIRRRLSAAIKGLESYTETSLSSAGVPAIRADRPQPGEPTAAGELAPIHAGCADSPPSAAAAMPGSLNRGDPCGGPPCVPAVCTSATQPPTPVEESIESRRDATETMQAAIVVGLCLLAALLLFAGVSLYDALWR